MPVGFNLRNPFYGPPVTARPPVRPLVDPPTQFSAAAGGQVPVRPPPGYTFDPVLGRFVPTVGSAQGALASQQRQETIEDQSLVNASRQQALAQQQQAFRNRMQQMALEPPQQVLESRPRPTGPEPPQQALWQQVSGGQMVPAPQPRPVYPGAISALDRILQSLSSGSAPSQGGGGGGALPPAPTFGASTGLEGALSASREAQRSEFGRAKGEAGALGRASIQGLMSDLAERGLIGSGVQARGMVQRLAETANPLSDIGAAQQRENIGITERAAQRAQEIASAAYQGGIAVRGQDIQAQLAREAAQAQAAEAAQARQLQLAAILSGLAGRTY